MTETVVFIAETRFAGSGRNAPHGLGTPGDFFAPIPMTEITVYIAGSQFVQICRQW
jgi:hypothetical protein